MGWWDFVVCSNEIAGVSRSCRRVSVPRASSASLQGPARSSGTPLAEEAHIEIRGHIAKLLVVVGDGTLMKQSLEAVRPKASFNRQ
jgi:hypothetical protein